MRVLDLFSGIGGFSLGLERAGMTTVAFCEIDPFCRRVLAKHWPGVPCYDDVRSLTAERLAADGISVDVICGGFPCQDISVTGRGAGLAGERSGLWSEYARLIGELRPSYVIVENVSALLGRGVGDVLGDLAAFGYDAEWDCVPAFAVGAPHDRDRIWIVAYPGEKRMGELSRRVNYKDFKRIVSEIQSGRFAKSPWAKATGFSGSPADLVRNAAGYGNHNGVSAGLDIAGALGNAVVPQIPELIGRAIMDAAA